jgi:hypothetical protein
MTKKEYLKYKKEKNAEIFSKLSKKKQRSHQHYEEKIKPFKEQRLHDAVETFQEASKR